MLPRKLSKEDIPKLVHHLTGLQGEDRRLRFGGTVSDDYIEQYITKSFDLTCKWFAIDHIDGYLVAACHASIHNGQSELGCSVNEDYRGQGFAQAMFDRAVTWLRTQGVTEVYMHCLTENQAMKHIARKNHMTLASESGETDALVEVQPANALTSYKDAMMDSMSMYDMMYKRNVNAWKQMMGHSNT